MHAEEIICSRDRLSYKRTYSYKQGEKGVGSYFEN
jgi:hypothetical protein